MLFFKECDAPWLTPCFEQPQLVSYFGRATFDRADLLAIEFDLLLAPVDVELARVHGFARRSRLLLRSNKGEPHATEIGIRGPHAGGGRRLASQCLGKPSAQRFDGASGLA